MKVTYLSNSSYAVNIDDALLIFDYYRVTPHQYAGLKGGVIDDDALLSVDKVFVFASHSHPDHFNKRIFEFINIQPNTAYFLDEGISSPVSTFSMTKGKTVKALGACVRALGSTDIGVSFFVEYGGVKLFHAGDLNCWHWKNEADEQYAETARTAFYAEMKEIKRLPRLDIAFFPVDDRMGEGYDEGAEYFNTKMKPKIFVPIHSERYLSFAAFAKKFDNVVYPTERGQTIIDE